MHGRSDIDVAVSVEKSQFILRAVYSYSDMKQQPLFHSTTQDVLTKFGKCSFHRNLLQKTTFDNWVAD